MKSNKPNAGGTMRILRLSTLSLTLAIAVITLGLAAAPALANPADENGCHDHKDCGGGGGGGGGGGWVGGGTGGGGSCCGRVTVDPPTMVQ